MSSLAVQSRSTLKDIGAKRRALFGRRCDGAKVVVTGSDGANRDEACRTRRAACGRVRSPFPDDPHADAGVACACARRGVCSGRCGRKRRRCGMLARLVLDCRGASRRVGSFAARLRRSSTRCLWHFQLLLQTPEWPTHCCDHWTRLRRLRRTGLLLSRSSALTLLPYRWEDAPCVGTPISRYHRRSDTAGGPGSCMEEASLLMERAGTGDRAAFAQTFALLFPEPRHIPCRGLSGGEYAETDQAMGVCSPAVSGSRDAGRPSHREARLRMSHPAGGAV